jgi:Type VI secretion system (T6SS), amidase effector protein 4
LANQKREKPINNDFIPKELAMLNFAPLIKYPMLRPSAHLMEIAYQDYITDSSPCKGGVVNQCAIRMSIALWRCGFSLEDLGFPHHRMHNRRKSCKVDIPHAVGAEDLARFLAKTWCNNLWFKGSKTESAATELLGKKGVIFFLNCWKRKGQTKKTGDHIDFWDGKDYFAHARKIAAGKEDPNSVGSMFGDSEEVWFFELHF